MLIQGKVVIGTKKKKENKEEEKEKEKEEEEEEEVIVEMDGVRQAKFYYDEGTRVGKYLVTKKGAYIDGFFIYLFIYFF